MKNTKKIFLVLLAMLAAFTLASCKAADDDDDKKSSVTTVATFYGMGKETGSYEGTEVLFTANIKATFYSNKEYKIDATINAIVSGNSKEKLISQDGTIEIGTYTGDPTKNGQIKTELGVAVQDDYPEFGCCILNANTTCDTSLMGNGIEQRHFDIPTHQVAVPINYTDPNVNDYSAQEIKDAIKFVEDQTGEKFDWDYYFKCMKIFNQETRNFLEWLEVNKTDYPQVVGNNIAPFRYAYYMVAGGREIGFLDAEKKINKLMYKAYENKVPVVSEVRHRAIVWGVQAQYYSHFPAWLQNCWGIIPLVDMLSLTSTKIYSEDDKEQAYYDMADLYANMVMRNRSEGGYQVGVEDLWRFCEEFRADVVIMYEHIGCKAVTGYHGLYEEQARKHNVHLIWVTHGLMDPRDASRQSMRNDVNRYMRTVFHEEPLDPSLEEFDDSNAY